MVKIITSQYYELKVNFPCNLIYLMKRDGISKEDFIKRMKINRTNEDVFHKWLRGYQYPSDKNIQSICDTFNWTRKELLEDSSHNYINFFSIEELEYYCKSGMNIFLQESKYKVTCDPRISNISTSFAAKNNNPVLFPFNEFQNHTYFILGDVKQVKNSNTEPHLELLYIYSSCKVIFKWVRIEPGRKKSISDRLYVGNNKHDMKKYTVGSFSKKYLRIAKVTQIINTCVPSTSIESEFIL